MAQKRSPAKKRRNSIAKDLVGKRVLVPARVFPKEDAHGAPGWEATVLRPSTDHEGHFEVQFKEKDIREWLKESIPETPKEPLRKETEDAEAAEEETMEQQTETTSGPTMQPNNLQTKRKSEVLASEAPEVGEQNDAAVEEGSEPRAQQRRRTEINEETPPSIGGAVVSVAKEVVLAAGGVAAAYLALQYFDVR